MKILLMMVLGISTLFGAAKVVEVGERFSDSQSCKACHLRIVNEWEESWHSKSHYQNDEYFQKSVDYVSRKTRKSPNSVKVQCATCHNPRISVTSTDMDYEIDAVMGLNKGSAVDKAVSDDAISEGINCVVCHNIDKIHDDRDATERGINRISWTESGTMTGPYKDAKSPYHKTIHHEFMDTQPNKLCFVCHANDRSVKGLVFTNMEKEYIKGAKTCVECHMGPKSKDVAATYKMYNGKAKIREVRHHGFAGAHSSNMWRDALSVSLSQKEKEIMIHINNPQPHNIPSGFGSREIIVDIFYKKGMNIIDKKSISLTNRYTRKKKRPTIPHLATKQSKDMSIPAGGKRTLKTLTKVGATSVEVKVYYRLVNDEIRSLLKLKGANWAEKHFITQSNLKLK
ncbi:MAG: multiheme c-type cytochrome [Campylobacterota bacterium]|nr:multiheme c-type cytochrome [Campylobacterota bacterium]